MAARIRLVCFDLGGVLVRICRSWAEGCRAAGLPVRGRSAGDAASRVRRTLMKEFATGRLTEAEWLVKVADALGGLYAPEELRRIHHAWTLREYDGVADLVEALHRADVPTACLSNTNSAHWARLVHHDGERPLPGEPEYPSVFRLRERHASHLLGLLKPDPAIYQEFERVSGCSGEGILFFDDLPENVAAARALGWNAERVNPRVETAPELRRVLERYAVL